MAVRPVDEGMERLEAGTILALCLLLAASAAGCIGADGGGDLETASDGDPRVPVDTRTVSVQETHDFSEGGGEVTFEVPENATVGEVRLFFDYWPGNQEPQTTGVCSAQEELSIELVDPAGNTYEQISYEGLLALGSGAACGSQVQSVWEPGVPAAPGEWTITFSGQGFAIGNVVFQS